MLAPGGRGVEATAEVGVDVVYAGQGVFDEDLARLKGRDGLGGGVFEDRGRAGLGRTDSRHGGGNGGGHFAGACLHVAWSRVVRGGFLGIELGSERC